MDWKDKLINVKKIYIHENCPDGIASAMIINAALPNKEIIPVTPGTDFYNNIGIEDGLLFCDMAPRDDKLEEFFKVGTIILDHHKSRKELLKVYIENDQGYFGDEILNPGVCGAVLAYRQEHVP